MPRAAPDKRPRLSPSRHAMDLLRDVFSGVAMLVLLGIGVMFVAFIVKMFLDKPYTADKLLRAVSTALAPVKA